MSEQEVAERFGQDLDDLLRHKEPDDWESAPPDYQFTLDIARVLTSNDMSGESQRRYATRQRLLSTAAGWEREARTAGDGFWQHPLVALPLALVTLALICTLILPGSSSWAHIGQPELSLPAIETPVAAAQTAFADLRGFGVVAAPTSAPLPTDVAPTPTQAPANQSLPANFFVATGTPAPLLR